MEGKRLNATLTFGMVVIPVGVVPVLDSTDRPSFKRLHVTCEKPIKQQLHCPTCDKDVENGDLVSGFEYAKGQFLVITDEERASVAANRSPMIEISKFVPIDNLAEEIRLGSDKSYWLAPQTEHVLHPYAVLANGMMEQGVIGVAKATVWTRQWPVAVEVIDGMFLLTQLHPASAVRQGGLVHPSLKPNERSMARSVISEFTSTLDENDLVSDADAALKDLVSAKLAGTKFEAPEVVTPEPTMDIMDALKASMPSKKKAMRTKVKA